MPRTYSAISPRIALFTAVLVPYTAKDPLAWIGDYPPAIRRRCEELVLVEAREGRFAAAGLARKAAATQREAEKRQRTHDYQAAVDKSGSAYFTVIFTVTVLLPDL
ncbi:MAG: hypothetical protein IKG22_02740 [Atopobiaceae bacterium]|nr:hypothetical protein [Atopobiaceae bacterium]